VIVTSPRRNVLSMVIFAIAAERGVLPWLFVSRIRRRRDGGNLAACQAAVADVTDGASRAAAWDGSAPGSGSASSSVRCRQRAQQHSSDGASAAAAALALVDLVGVALLMPETRIAAQTTGGRCARWALARAGDRRPEHRPA